MLPLPPFTKDESLTLTLATQITTYENSLIHSPASPPNLLAESHSRALSSRHLYRIRRSESRILYHRAVDLQMEFEGLSRKERKGEKGMEVTGRLEEVMEDFEADTSHFQREITTLKTQNAAAEELQ